jgi:hypothetical protein
VIWIMDGVAVRMNVVVEPGGQERIARSAFHILAVSMAPVPIHGLVTAKNRGAESLVQRN